MSSEQRPAVSVVMPVHNAGPYLDDSVSSVLAQTFTDFELVVLENGSTDGSGAVLQAWAEKDARVRLFSVEGRLGRAGSSNEVVACARGDVVVRMDADDVCRPERVEREVSVLAAHREAVLVGTLYDGIDDGGRPLRPRDRSRLLRRGIEAPFPHGSCAFRRRAFDQVGGYRELCEGWEDLDLLHRLAEIGQVLVLPVALYSIRFHQGSAHRSMAADRFLAVAAAKDRIVSERFPSVREPEDADRAVGALYERAAEQLWSGARPELLAEVRRRGLLVRVRRRRWRLGWAVWARFSPRTLRWTLRVAIRARDILAGLQLRGNGPVEWCFG